MEILYALTSTDKDIYIEQLWVSVTSLTIIVNPDTKLKKLCKFMIEKAICIYWLFQRF